jgi:hypothetical protein
MGRMDDRLREKLAKLLGMFGSDNANEREIARSKIVALLTANGISWSDLTDLIRTAPGRAGYHAAAPPPPDPTDTGPKLFDLLCEVIAAFVHFRMKPHQPVTVALWALHTFVYDQFMITPRLPLLSPVRGCGKSTVHDILNQLTFNPLKYDHVGAAGLLTRHRRRAAADAAVG